MSKAVSVFVGITFLGGSGYYLLGTPSPHPVNERCGNSSPLKSLTSAQADFAANDRDNNDKQDFWRKDLASLYTMTDAKGTMLQSIELSIALADEHPASDLKALGVRGPRNGYWFRTLLHEDEDPKKPDPKRFAYAAIPVDAKDPVFIVDENNTIFRAHGKDYRDIKVFPRDVGEAGWSKLD